MQRQENMEGQARAKSWGLRGGFAEEVWHPSWALKNEEVVERQGQWGRHLAEGTAREQRQRGVKLRGESEISAIKLQPRPGRGGDSCSIKSCGHGGPGGRQVKALGKTHWGLVPLPCPLQSGYWYCPLPGSLAQTTLIPLPENPAGPQRPSLCLSAPSSSPGKMGAPPEKWGYLGLPGATPLPRGPKFPLAQEGFPPEDITARARGSLLTRVTAADASGIKWK